MTNAVINTALKAIANEPEAALSGGVTQTVEATSGWLESFTAWVGKIDGYVSLNAFAKGVIKELTDEYTAKDVVVRALMLKEFNDKVDPSKFSILIEGATGSFLIETVTTGEKSGEIVLGEDVAKKPQRGDSAVGLPFASSKTGLVPTGNFRGTLSGMTIAAENLSDTDGRSGTRADKELGTLKRVPGGNPNLTVTRRELVRTKAFIQQMNTHRQAVETVANSVVEGKSSSVTIHGHSLDLNDLSEHHNGDGAPGPGAE